MATTVAEVRAWRATARGTIGLVPTMGYLHAGHLSLVQRCRRDNDWAVASLFVNPTQFGPQEDLGRYPRDFEGDRRRLEDTGCDLLFAPPAEEMYPAGFDTFVEPGAIASPLEGARRPGHFRGVATVVVKLFEVTSPSRAYFGEKDAQQLAVIRKVVRDLGLSVEVVGCPTVREADGLAMSSRNSYLDAAERAAAPVLHRALMAARERWQAGERNGERLRQAVRDVLAEESRARVDYVSVADPETLRELDVAEGGALASLAVFMGRARLIDNVILE